MGNNIVYKNAWLALTQYHGESENNDQLKLMDEILEGVKSESNIKLWKCSSKTILGKLCLMNCAVGLECEPSACLLSPVYEKWEEIKQ